MQLELLPEHVRKHPNIDFCTQLDQHLMVGSYDQVLSAAENPPVAYYSFFLRSLLKTVRVNVGDCAAAAYRTLEVSAATRMLMFHSDQETLHFVSETYPGWTVEGTVIHLQGTKTTSKSEIPSVKLIQQQLTYANELERIV